MQRDPIGLRGGANVYVYAKSSPSYFIDELGLMAGRPSRAAPREDWPKGPSEGDHCYWLCVNVCYSHFRSMEDYRWEQYVDGYRDCNLMVTPVRDKATCAVMAEGLDSGLRSYNRGRLRKCISECEDCDECE